MNSRLTELQQYIDAQTASLRAAFESIPAGQRAVRPIPDRWSAAEVVHHVVIVERRLSLRLAALIEQARALPPEGHTAVEFPDAIATRVVDRTRRFVTSEAGEPRDTKPERVSDDLEDAHDELTRVIATADGLPLGAVSAPHPALGLFTGYDWIAFAGAHAARHAAQIRELAASMPAADA